MKYKKSITEQGTSGTSLLLHGHVPYWISWQ